MAGVSDMSAAAWDFRGCAPILVQPSLTAACFGAGGARICGISALAASAAAINAPRRSPVRSTIVIAAFRGAFFDAALTPAPEHSWRGPAALHAAPLSPRGQEACRDGVLRPLGSQRAAATRPTLQLAEVGLCGFFGAVCRHAFRCPEPRPGSFFGDAGRDTRHPKF